MVNACVQTIGNCEGRKHLSLARTLHGLEGHRSIRSLIFCVLFLRKKSKGQNLLRRRRAHVWQCVVHACCEAGVNEMFIRSALPRIRPLSARHAQTVLVESCFARPLWASGGHALTPPSLVGVAVRLGFCFVPFEIDNAYEGHLWCLIALSYVIMDRGMGRARYNGTGSVGHVRFSKGERRATL